jgi:hypothetical protein
MLTRQQYGFFPDAGGLEFANWRAAQKIFNRFNPSFPKFDKGIPFFSKILAERWTFVVSKPTDYCLNA